MKKFFAAILAIVLAITVCGCNSNNDQQSTNTSNNSGDEIIASVSKNDEVDVSLFREVETSPENIDVYRAEVQSRLQHEQFLTPAEEDLLSRLMSDKYSHVAIKQSYIVTFKDLYASTSEYYFPVIFREGSSLILWYTTEYGNVLLEKIHGYWNDSNVIGDLHVDYSDEEVMFSSYNYKMTYDTETATARVWQFGQVDTTYELPSGSVYCGFSAFEGHIFRCNTEVYALDAGTMKFSGTIKRIATDVKYVISANYYFGSDPWSQPLFLMEDGSIKCYVSWEGDVNAPADDSSHLCDLRYEGGYR